MKTKLFLTGFILAMGISSCTAPAYLPKSKNIDENQYGSYINIQQKKGPFIQGELLSSDGVQLIVLTDNKKTKLPVKVPVNQINHFELRYAQPKHYGWTIPLFTAATLGHGVFLLFTAPINIIGTVIVTASGEDAFMYTEKDITYEKLNLFARFPQGIPSNIELSSIK